MGTTVLRRAQLRAQAMERAGGRCEFPRCSLPLNEINALQMAHLKGSGMGGSRYRDNLMNVAMLCMYHHRWLDEGPRYENEQVLRAALNRWWEDRR